MCISVEEAKRLAAQFNGLPYAPGTRYSNSETYDQATGEVVHGWQVFEQIREDVIRADHADSDPETDAGMEFVRQRSEAQAQLDQWEAERRKQRYIQWPAAWADAMLDQRGGA